MTWALSRPARATTGAYYEVAASPKGDLLLSYPGPGPVSPNDATPGALGFLSMLINTFAFRGRWRVVVRQAFDTRGASPTSGILWRTEVRKSEVERLMTDLVARIEAGTFNPEQAIDGVV